MNICNNIIWSCPLDCSGYSQCGQDYVLALSSNGFNLKYLTPKVSALIDGKGIDAKLREKLIPLINTKINNPYVMVSHSVPDRFTIDMDALLNIGYTVVETEIIPNKWPHLCNKMDAIFTASDFCKSILKKNGVIVPIYVVPHCHDKSIITYDKFNIQNLKGFNFLFMADMTPRKGWEYLVAAFCNEFSPQDDVSLTFKVYFHDFSTQSQENCKNKIRAIIKDCGKEANITTAPIYFYGHCLPSSQVMKFINSFDCIVSPHRGEGWGLILSQAMILGKPTIATNYSGNLEFMTPENSILIDANGWEDIPEEMLKINPNYGGLKWPTINVYQLQESMRKLYRNKQLANKIGQNAKEQILNNFSYERISDIVKSAINELIKNKYGGTEE